MCQVYGGRVSSPRAFAGGFHAVFSVNGEYDARWNSVAGYYERTQALGATFILLVHDLWSADAVCSVPFWPGDNDDWTAYTDFMTQVIDDGCGSKRDDRLECSMGSLE